MIDVTGFTYKKTQFPCGEIGIDIEHISKPDSRVGNLCIIWNFENVSEIIEVSLLVHTLKLNYGQEIDLILPYVPFSRQDRKTHVGGCFSLKWFCELINGLKFTRVCIQDPHSYVITALLDNVKEKSQASVFTFLLLQVAKNPFNLICPDAGAIKKINACANIEGLTNKPTIIECSKHRNELTGEITGTKVNCDDLGGRDCYIVDDICDGGGTFIAIAKALKEKNPGKIVLCVTHGFFTRGLEVFDGLIDEIYTSNGQVK